MAFVNENYLKLSAGYLFPEIARRVNAFAEQNSGIRIIRLGIGDVTEPLPAAVARAMHKAVDDMTTISGFHGYGPENGYAFLRDAIVEHDYKSRGCDIAADEVFVSDGSKCDCGNILDILGQGNTIAVADPVYPVYVDTNVMAGHTGAKGSDGRYEGLVYLPATAESNFAPALPDRPVDVIYLCFPNNPTGAVASRETLQLWVDYARANKALLLFDAAYEAFISDDSIPHSIYEIEGARECAVEFRSFSKTAGFTGTRCAFTVVPKSLMGRTKAGESANIHTLWKRRQSTKFNGVAYIVQRGAEAAYSPEGREQIKSLIAGYMSNAATVKTSLEGIGLTVFGARNAPYAWIRCPDRMTSWEAFDHLLNNAGVVCTPGIGFGGCGEGYIRLSAFNSRANVDEALQRITDALV